MKKELLEVFLHEATVLHLMTAWYLSYLYELLSQALDFEELRPASIEHVSLI